MPQPGKEAVAGPFRLLFLSLRRMIKATEKTAVRRSEAQEMEAVP